MTRHFPIAAIAMVALFIAAPAYAQSPPATLPATPPATAPATPPANPLDAIPDKMPNSIPFGAPISLQREQDAIAAAMAEATKRGWPLNVAVVDSGANLVAFARMDGGQLASIAIAEHKARASVKFRRPTKSFEDGCRSSTTNTCCRLTT